MSFKSQREIYEALLDGKTLQHIETKLQYRLDEKGYLIDPKDGT